MHFYGPLHLLESRWRQPAERRPEEDLPEIVRGAFSTWAQSWTDAAMPRAVAGDACVLPDGRRGHLVETADGGYPLLVCQPG